MRVTGQKHKPKALNGFRVDLTHNLQMYWWNLLAVLAISHNLIHRALGKTKATADNQLERWKKAHAKVPATGNHHEHVSSLTATVGMGDKGPLFLEDLNFQVQLSTFVRERIPERFNHAKGSGAKGYFVLTHDMSRYTKAIVFHGIGKKTPVVVRFSTCTGNSGSSDTAVDSRGFAVKFKTTAGNYDLTMLNMPAFHTRDPILFPAVARAFRRNPATNIPNFDALYDMFSLRPEMTLNTLQTSATVGFPNTYRHMEGHSINAFRWTGGTATKQSIFVRYHVMPNQKKNVPLTFKEYQKLASDPDYMVRDLYNSIASKKYPSWTVYIQMFTMDDVKKSTFDLFDPTKMLFEKEFPMIPLGKLVLNQNPVDYFNEVEQLAFNPGNLVPGIEPSPDRLLQGRIFAYLQANLHRLGSNFYQIPINGPRKGVNTTTYLRDGVMNIYGNGDGGPNFFPNSFNGPYVDPKAKVTKTYINGGHMEAVDTPGDDDLVQVDRYWREVMTTAEKKNAVESIAYTLSQASRKIQEKSLKANWEAGNPELGKMLREELDRIRNRSKRSKK